VDVFSSDSLLKDIVYREKMQNVNELHYRIIRAAECVTNEMLTSTWQETEYDLDVCHATNSAHSELYWAHKLCENITVSPIQFMVEDIWRFILL